jgi:hypothetical protein
MGIIKHLSAALPEKEFTLTTVGENRCDRSFGRFGNSTIGLVETEDVHNFSRVALV